MLRLVFACIIVAVLVSLKEKKEEETRLEHAAEWISRVEANGVDTPNARSSHGRANRYLLARAGLT